jgi:hypothetical protein
MLTTILIVIAAALALAVAVVVVLASQKPDTFRVQRSALINAPPENIFPHINDFRRWTSWSPWEHKDPNMKRTYGASSEGVGATYAWEGNGQVGAGNMQITDSTAPAKIGLVLNMIKPMQAHNAVAFTLEPKAAATEVTWTMTGRTPFIGKIMHVFMDMDRMVGGDFDTGLANLKRVAEGPGR